MRLHTSGKKKLGAFFDASFGACYLAFRRPKDIYRNDKGRERKRSVSQSVLDGDALWALDVGTLIEARRSGVALILILMRPQRIVYYTPIDYFFDPEKYRAMNYTGKGGSDQRYLPVKFFNAIDLSHKI